MAFRYSMVLRSSISCIVTRIVGPFPEILFQVYSKTLHNKYGLGMIKESISMIEILIRLHISALTGPTVQGMTRIVCYLVLFPEKSYNKWIKIHGQSDH